MGEDLTPDVSDVAEKVAFARPEWVAIARTVLEEVVAEHGEPGKSFSVCEVFTDAPPGDGSSMPPYLVELHNRLAAATQ